MDPLKTRGRPEDKIQAKVMAYLRRKGWFVINIHGNKYSSGLPDLFACHHLYGQRWIEIKLPDFKGSKFTAAQNKVFPQLCKNGSDVWILTADTDDEYQKLFRSGNYWEYLDVWRK